MDSGEISKLRSNPSTEKNRENRILAFICHAIILHIKGNLSKFDLSC